MAGGSKQFTIFTKFAVKNGFTGPVLNMAKGADKLARGLQTAHQVAGKVGSGLQKVGKFAMIGAGAAVAAGVGILSLAKKSEEAADDIQNTAGALGISTKALQEYRYVGIQAGLTTEDMDTALTKLTKNLGKGGASVDNALYQIGVTADQLKAAGPEKSLELVADGFKNIKDPQVKAAVAMELFGKSSVRMVNALNGGAEGIAATRKEAEDIGYVMGGDMLKNAGDLNDQLDKLGATATGLGNRIIARAIPGVSKLVDSLQKGIQPGGKFGKIIDSIGNFLGKGGDVLGPVFDKMADFIPKLFDFAGQIVEALKPIIDPLIGMLEPILKIFENLMPLIKAVVSIVSQILGPILEVVKYILNGVAEITGNKDFQSAIGGGVPAPQYGYSSGPMTPVSSQTSMVSSQTTTNKSELAITLGGQTAGTQSKLTGNAPGITLQTKTTRPGAPR